MNNKCISIIVLFTFLHYLVAGCVKTTMVQQEKLSVESTECCVYAVILTTGEKYEFEKPGGRYNVVPHLLTGKLNDGRKFFLDLADENIKEIRISTGQTISRGDLTKNPDQTISEILVDGNIYSSTEKLYEFYRKLIGHNLVISSESENSGVFMARRENLQAGVRTAVSKPTASATPA